MEAIDAHIKVMTLGPLLYSLTIADRMTFLRFLEDEFAGTDDEFGLLADKMMFCLYTCTNARQLEHAIGGLIELGDEDKMCMLLQCVLDYIQDFIQNG